MYSRISVVKLDFSIENKLLAFAGLDLILLVDFDSADFYLGTSVEDEKLDRPVMEV